MLRQLDFEAMEVLILLWHDRFASQPFKAGDVCKALAENAILLPASQIGTLIGDHSVMSPAAVTRIGIVLARSVGKAVKGMALVRKRNSTTGQWTYQIVAARGGMPLLVPRVTTEDQRATYMDPEATIESLQSRLVAWISEGEAMRDQLRDLTVQMMRL